MTTVAVQQEIDYVVIDSREWVENWRERTTDVTDHWREVITRAHTLGTFGEQYSESGTFRDMRDYLRKKEYDRNFGEYFYAVWTGNAENLFDTDMGIVAVRYNDRILVFVEYSPMGSISVPDVVMQFDDWDDVSTFIQPRVEGYCPTSANHGIWESYNGMTFDAWDSQHESVRADNAVCPTCGTRLEFEVNA